jgi:hypothetical protein
MARAMQGEGDHFSFVDRGQVIQAVGGRRPPEHSRAIRARRCGRIRRNNPTRPRAPQGAARVSHPGTSNDRSIAPGSPVIGNQLRLRIVAGCQDAGDGIEIRPVI